MKLIKTFVLFIVFVISVTGFAQIEKYDIKEVLKIGGAEIVDENYIFVAPQEINTDSSGNIYIRDVISVMGFASKEILKYDSHGNFVKKIGRFGQGPGEFQRIGCFCINGNDELAIYDCISKKISFYNTDGIFLREVRLNTGSMKEIKSIQFSKNKYVINEIYWDKPEEPIFAFLDNDVNSIIESFGSRKSFWDFKNDIKFSEHRSRGGKILWTVNSSGCFLGANKLYDGTAVFFKKEKDDWVFHSVEGERPDYEPYKLFSMVELGKGIKLNQNFFKKRANVGTKVSSSGRYNFRYTYFNKNIGIYNLNDKHFIQFVIHSTKKKKYELGFNVFTSEGEFIQYQSIRTYKKNILSHVNVIGATNGNEFFITDDEDDCPIIKKILIE